MFLYLLIHHRSSESLQRPLGGGIAYLLRITGQAPKSQESALQIFIHYKAMPGSIVATKPLHLTLSPAFIIIYPHLGSVQNCFIKYKIENKYSLLINENIYNVKIYNFKTFYCLKL